MVVSLDPARAGDAIRILALLHAAYSVEARLIGAGRFPPLERTLTSVMRSESAWFGVADGDALVAAVELEEHDDATWARDADGGSPGLLIASLVVEPARFRQGLGRALVRHVLELAATRGDRPVRVSTATANEPASKLYRGLGFETVGEAERAGIPLTRFERASAG